MTIQRLAIKTEQLTAEIRRLTVEKEKFARALLNRDRIREMHKEGK